MSISAHILYSLSLTFVGERCHNFHSRQQHLCDKGLDPGFIRGKNCRALLHSNVEEKNTTIMKAKQYSSCTHIVRKSVT